MKDDETNDRIAKPRPKFSRLRALGSVAAVALLAGCAEASLVAHMAKAVYHANERDEIHADTSALDEHPKDANSDETPGAREDWSPPEQLAYEDRTRREEQEDGWLYTDPYGNEAQNPQDWRSPERAAEAPWRQDEPAPLAQQNQAAERNDARRTPYQPQIARNQATPQYDQQPYAQQPYPQTAYRQPVQQQPLREETPPVDPYQTGQIDRAPARTTAQRYYDPQQQQAYAETQRVTERREDEDSAGYSPLLDAPSGPQVVGQSYDAGGWLYDQGANQLSGSGEFDPVIPNMHYVQVGSFLDPLHAEEMRFLAENVVDGHVVVNRFDTAEGVFRRVRLGPFETAEEAADALRLIQGLGHTEAIHVRP